MRCTSCLDLPPPPPWCRKRGLSPGGATCQEVRSTKCRELRCQGQRNSQLPRTARQKGQAAQAICLWQRPRTAQHAWPIVSAKQGRPLSYCAAALPQPRLLAWSKAYTGRAQGWIQVLACLEQPPMHTGNRQHTGRPHRGRRGPGAAAAAAAASCWAAAPAARSARPSRTAVRVALVILGAWLAVLRGAGAILRPVKGCVVEGRQTWLQSRRGWPEPAYE